jgi:hypothetical protein
MARNSTSRAKRSPASGRPQALDRAQPDEAASVLRMLLARHPELAEEAGEIARELIAAVDVEAVAREIERTVLGLPVQAIGTRTGRQPWGYVEPTEAAWALLGDAVEPFLDELRRRIELGFEAAAVATCEGIVLGLYRCRGENVDRALSWAADFPADTAAHAVEVLARESMVRHGRPWRLPGGLGGRVPAWAQLLERAAKR